MSNRPAFLDDLKQELTTAAKVAERRRATRRRWTTIGAGTVAAGALGMLLATSPTDSLREDQDSQVEAVARTLDGPASIGDDLLIYDLRLQTGERFRLQVPAAFGGELTLIEPAAPKPVIIKGARGLITISFQPCAVETEQTADGSVETGAAPAFTVCGTNPLLAMTVDPADPAADDGSQQNIDQEDIDQFNLRVLESGSRYGPILTSAFEQFHSCGNCVTWGPMVFPNEAIAIHTSGPATVEAIALLGSLEAVWTVDFDNHTGAGLNLFAQDDGVLVDLVGGPIVKLNLDGEEQWRFDRDGGEQQLDVFGSFFLTSFTGADDNRPPLVRRIDLATGELSWAATGQVGADWQPATPVIFGNTLVVMDLRDQNMTGPIAMLHGFDITSGETTWTADLGVTRRARDRGLLALFDFEDGRGLFVRSTDGDVLRFDPLSGDVLWRTTIPGAAFGGTEFDPSGALALDITSPSGRFLLDPATGQIVSSGSELGNTGRYAAADDGLFTCPVTVAPDFPYTPPEPWPPRPSSPNSIWYGTGDLWTVHERTGHTPRKSVWWSARFPGGAAEPAPELSVTYRRLDPDADEQSTVTFDSPGTNAFTPEDGSFMINGLEPDEQGCWQATATYKGATLSYVYEVN